MDTLGRYLRKARKEKGISLDEIAGITKINLRYLSSIEEGGHGLLPAEVFVVGFLRQYAQVVGLDPEEVVARYRMAAAGRGRGSPDRESSRYPTHGKKALLLLAGLLFCLCLLWLFLRPGESITEGRIRAIRVPKSSKKEILKAQLWKDLELDSRVSSSGLVEENGSVEGGFQTRAYGESPLSQDRGKVEIMVQGSRKTWIQVEMDDRPVLERSLKPGDQLAFRANERIQLRIGNGNGVRIVYRGKIIENLGDKDDIIQITFPPLEPG
ncbi:MAG: RodZ domain-containing protein [bacterium]